MAETEQSTVMPRASISDLNDDLGRMVCSVIKLKARVSDEKLAGPQVKAAFAEMFA